MDIKELVEQKTKEFFLADAAQAQTLVNGFVEIVEEDRLPPHILYATICTGLLKQAQSGDTSPDTHIRLLAATLTTQVVRAIAEKAPPPAGKSL